MQMNLGKTKFIDLLSHIYSLAASAIILNTFPRGYNYGIM